MNARTGAIIAGLGLLIGCMSLYFYDAAEHVVTPEDVIWGLGRLFRDIDPSDIILLQRIGLAGMVTGGLLLLVGLALMHWRNQ